MRKMPDDPRQEFIVSISGPLTNIAIAVIFFYPLYKILGPENLFSPSLATWPQTFAYAFWINPGLAIFNLIPAFPMDGGRLLRAFLAKRMDYRKATRIAVGFGHAFALFFAIWGILHNHISLVIIAMFVYFAASQEGQQVDIRMTLRRFRVQDILSKEFHAVSPENTVAEILNMVFIRHQEDFPVVEGGRLVGFLSRNEILHAVHSGGLDKKARELMRKEFPVTSPAELLSNLYIKLEKANLKAVPVLKDKELLGLVSLEDISRVYALISRKS